MKKVNIMRKCEGSTKILFPIFLYMGCNNFVKNLFKFWVTTNLIRPQNRCREKSFHKVCRCFSNTQSKGIIRIEGFTKHFKGLNTGLHAHTHHHQGSRLLVKHIQWSIWYLSGIVLNSKTKLHSFWYPKIFAAQIVLKLICKEDM